MSVLNDRSCVFVFFGTLEHVLKQVVKPDMVYQMLISTILRKCGPDL